MASENFKSLGHISPGLKDELVSKALTDWFQTKVRFTRWKYVGEPGKGDSYLSEVSKIIILGKDTKGEKYSVQVILKRIPTSASRRLTFRSNEFFKNEILFYTEVLPAMLDFQASRKICDPFKNYTKLFYSYSDGENDVILLEDVTVQQFGPAVRQKGLSYEHCQVVLLSFAKFHGLSIAMKHQRPEEYKKITNLLQEQYYHERLREWYGKFWDRLCRVAIDAVENQYPNSMYVERAKKFCVPETFDKMCAAVKESEANGVISHGDSWTNNFLFKYTGNKKPIDTKIIDFQLARCGSPVLDISFFIYSSTTCNVREEHYENLMQYYYNTLARQINELGTNAQVVYSLDQFRDEIKKYSFFGLAFSFESTPFIILDPEDAFNMDMEGDTKLNIDDVWQVPLFKTVEGRQREADNVVHAVHYEYI